VGWLLSIALNAEMGFLMVKCKIKTPHLESSNSTWRKATQNPVREPMRCYFPTSTNRQQKPHCNSCHIGDLFFFLHRATTEVDPQPLSFIGPLKVTCWPVIRPSRTGLSCFFTTALASSRRAERLLQNSTFASVDELEEPTRKNYTKKDHHLATLRRSHR
jgi:hypothetical protein